MFYNFLFSKSKYQNYGVNFSYKIPIKKLYKLAHRMIKNCELWKSNWEKVLQEIDAEITEIMLQEFHNDCKGLNDDEIDLLIEKIKNLRNE